MSNKHQKIHFINIALMLLSGFFAFFLPFELFIFAYAILGPLHYLTEISWLHDRNYFTKKPYDVFFLLLPVVPSYICLILKIDLNDHWHHLGLATALIFSALGVFVSDRLWRFCIFATSLNILVLVYFSLPAFFIIFFLFLTTIIHVYVFTGLFILFGALKEESRVGLLSLLIYLVIPCIFLLYVPDSSLYQTSFYFLDAASGFSEVQMHLKNIFFTNNNWDTTVATMRFIAYAYTYHYLNWFSKTKVIKWHEVGYKRFGVILFAYILSVSAYLIDYQFGLIVLFLLSLFHVILEFPLNFRSIEGVLSEIKKGTLMRILKAKSI